MFAKTMKYLMLLFLIFVRKANLCLHTEESDEFYCDSLDDLTYFRNRYYNNIKLNLLDDIKFLHVHDLKLQHVGIDTLELKNVQLEVVEPGSFGTIPSLRTLNLQDNNIALLYNDTFQYLEELKNLKLNGNILRNVESGSFIGLKNLEQLDLSGNKLETWSYFCFNFLQKLTVLNLDHNNLKYLGGTGNFPALKTNTLSSNFITHLNFSLTAPDLKLDISSQSIVFIAPSTFNGINITSFNVSHNNLINLEKMSNHYITTLDVSYNDLTMLSLNNLTGLANLSNLYMKGNAIKLLSGTAHFTNLKQFDLSYNKLSQFDLDSINVRDLDISFNNLKYIYGCTNYSLLENINISHNNLTNLNNFTLSINNSITHLLLPNNNIEKLPDYFFKSLKKIEVIDISNNKIISLQYNTIENLPNLKYLDVSRNFISNLFNGSLHGSFALERINISNNHIKELKWPIFRDLIRLEILNASCNNISIMHNTFEGLENIVLLDLSYNNISSLEKHIFQDLVKLRKLFLNNNNIEVLPEELLSNQYSLIEVHLDNNRIFNFPLNLFPTNSVINDIYISHNNIYYLLPGVFSDLQNLRVLDISFNNLIEFPPTLYSHSLNNLRYLNLKSNNIKTIDADILKHLPNLLVLGLHNNSLSCSSLQNILNKKLALHLHLNISAGGERNKTNIRGISCLHELSETILSLDDSNLSNDAVSQKSSEKILENSDFYKCFQKGYKETNFFKYFGENFKQSYFFKYFNSDLASSPFLMVLKNSVLNSINELKKLSVVDNTTLSRQATYDIIQSFFNVSTLTSEHYSPLRSNVEVKSKYDNVLLTFIVILLLGIMLVLIWQLVDKRKLLKSYHEKNFGMGLRLVETHDSVEI